MPTEINMYPKSASAQKVLELMDGEEDGGGRYEKFVKEVATEAGISISQLENELESFI